MVQLKLRFKESTRLEVAAAAKRRGISMNAEIVDRIESGIAINTLGEGWFGISDLARFRDFVSIVKMGLAAAGEDQEQWLAYARHVPFPIDANDPSSYEPALAAVRAAVDADHKDDAAFIQAYNKKNDGAPEKNVARRSRGETEEAAEYFWRAERLKRVEQNRRRKSNLDADGRG